MVVHVSVVRSFRSSGGQWPFRLNTLQKDLLLLPYLFLLLLFGWSVSGHAACGEEISAATQELVSEEQALRTTIQAVQSSRSRLQAFDANLQTLLDDSSRNYDKALARRLATLRHAEVEPKRRTLENLRSQHEESRRQWERGHQQLGPQFAEAQMAHRAKTMTNDEFCRVRETYAYALRLYLQGMQDYRRGMDLYAHALDEYVDRFVSPYIEGFTNPRYWEELIVQLQRGDFLHDVLVPMTANAVRGVPPSAPPE
jgi:hypothetical protein